MRNLNVTDGGVSTSPVPGVRAAGDKNSCTVKPVFKRHLNTLHCRFLMGKIGHHTIKVSSNHGVLLSLCPLNTGFPAYLIDYYIFHKYNNH